MPRGATKKQSLTDPPRFMCLLYTVKLHCNKMREGGKKSQLLKWDLNFNFFRCTLRLVGF